MIEMMGSKSNDVRDDHHHRHLHRRDHHPMDGGDDDGLGEPPLSGVSCSICLEMVSDDGCRSRARLQCGHEFHLDCIGSAFNMKGAMQCPNCRKIEKGQWLYANGSARSLPEFSMEDWIPDEDFYDLSYSEMPFRVHWCPFGELTRFGSSFEELESPSTSYHDIRRHHALFAEHAAASAVARSYLAYVGPIPPATSRSSDNADDSNFNHHWNGLSGHSETFNLHAFPAINIQYHSWGRHSPSFSLTNSHINSADPAPVPPVTLRSSHSETGGLSRSGLYPHPFLFDYGSGPRAGSSFVSSVVPHHPGSNAQTHERIQVSHAFHHLQQPSNPPGIPSPAVPVMRGGLPTVVPAPPQPDQNGGFFVFPPSSSSSQNLHEVENPLPNRFHAWERDRLSRLPVASRDSGWGSYHHGTASSDSVNRSTSFRRRHLS